MTVATFIDRMRTREESLMDNTCVVTRGGTRTFDPNTGSYSTATGTTVYSGKYLLRPVSSRDAEVGEQALSLESLLLKLPGATTGVRKGDTVTFADNPDADISSRTFTVDHVVLDDWKITLRVFVSEHA